jgi:hypothetical protein
LRSLIAPSLRLLITPPMRSLITPGRRETTKSRKTWVRYALCEVRPLSKKTEKPRADKHEFDTPCARFGRFRKKNGEDPSELIAGKKAEQQRKRLFFVRGRAAAFKTNGEDPSELIASKKAEQQRKRFFFVRGRAPKSQTALGNRWPEGAGSDQGPKNAFRAALYDVSRALLFQTCEKARVFGRVCPQTPPGAVFAESRATGSETGGSPRAKKTSFRPVLYDVSLLLLIQNLMFYRVFRTSDGQNFEFFEGSARKRRLGQCLRGVGRPSARPHEVFDGPGRRGATEC